MGCPICGNEGNCIETWVEDNKIHNAFYCETCSEVYYDSSPTTKKEVQDDAIQ